MDDCDSRRVKQPRHQIAAPAAQQRDNTDRRPDQVQQSPHALHAFAGLMNAAMGIARAGEFTDRTIDLCARDIADPGGQWLVRSQSVLHALKKPANLNANKLNYVHATD